MSAMIFLRSHALRRLFVSTLLLTAMPLPSLAQRPTAAIVARPVTVEWVYRVKYGYQDEWWQLFIAK